jgi:hypothetical protein
MAIIADAVSLEGFVEAAPSKDWHGDEIAPVEWMQEKRMFASVLMVVCGTVALPDGINVGARPVVVGARFDALTKALATPIIASGEPLEAMCSASLAKPARANDMATVVASSTIMGGTSACA